MAELGKGASALEEVVVTINRCTVVTKGGKNLSFSALVVVGDKQGNVGCGFGTVTLGAVRADPYKPGVGSEWLFGIGLGAGAKVFLSEKIGLRFQGRLLLPFAMSGGGMWCGTGTGCSVGLGASTTIAMGDFTAGLIFSF